MGYFDWIFLWLASQPSTCPNGQRESPLLARSVGTTPAGCMTRKLESSGHLCERRVLLAMRKTVAVADHGFQGADLL